MIKCKCGGATTVVGSGRSYHRNGQRRRKCKTCGILFTTYEIREDEQCSFGLEELNRLEDKFNQAIEDMEGAVSRSFNRLKARTHE